MSITTNFPAIRPTLNLDFVNSRTVDPRITFTRASTATYYDGKTFAKAEENLLKFSQEFNNAVWSKGKATITPNAAVAPDGTLTADTISDTASTGLHIVHSTNSTTASANYTFSAFYKDVNRRYIRHSFVTNHSENAIYVDVDLQSGTIVNQGQVGGGILVGASITAVGDGWYRVSVSGSLNSGTTYCVLTLRDASTNVTTEDAQYYTGDGTSGILMWGAQLEQRSSVTDYTPTTDQPITRYVPQLMTAAANTPRIDFDPITGACRGLLIEEQRTNLLLRSQEFDNASWGKNNVTVTANAAVAPDGTLTADKVVPTASTGLHFLYQGAGPGATATLSVYAKKGEYNFCTIFLSGSSIRSTRTFNLTTGEITNPYDFNSTFISAQAINVGNGWWRLTVSATTANHFNTVRIAPAVDTSSGHSDSGQQFTGDGYSGIYIWGAQLEAGAFPTSYIPTGASQVTRAADSAVMTGTNFSSWYRQDEGTLFAEASFTNASSTSGVVAVGDPTLAFSSAETIYLGFVSSMSGRPVLAVFDAGVSQVSSLAAAGTATANTPIKMAAAYKLNDFATTFSGAPPATDTSGTVPTPTGCSIGEYSQRWIGGGGSTRLNGHIRRIAYYPARLPNAQLQALTA